LIYTKRNTDQRYRMIRFRATYKIPKFRQLNVGVVKLEATPLEREH
jgi:hypothetical protein